MVSAMGRELRRRCNSRSSRRPSRMGANSASRSSGSSLIGWKRPYAFLNWSSVSSSTAKRLPRSTANTLRSSSGDSRAQAVQFAQQQKALADGSEFGVEIFRQFPHRVEAAVRILELEQRVVEHREEAAAQYGEYAEVIVGRLEGAGGAIRAAAEGPRGWERIRRRDLPAVPSSGGSGRTHS